MYIYMYIYIYNYVHIYIYIHVYIHVYSTAECLLDEMFCLLIMNILTEVSIGCIIVSSVNLINTKLLTFDNLSL